MSDENTLIPLAPQSGLAALPDLHASIIELLAQKDALNASNDALTQQIAASNDLISDLQASLDAAKAAPGAEPHRSPWAQ